MNKTKNETQIIAEKGKQELFITREFNTKRELVFKAFNDPELLKEWMGPREMTMEVDVFENKTGGYWRFIHSDPKGNKFGFNGVVHELSAPERVIRTFEFEGLPEKGHVSLEIMTFDVLPGGRTKITIQSIFRSVADRDGMVMSGMEKGVVDSYARLDEMLEKSLMG